MLYIILPAGSRFIQEAGIDYYVQVRVETFPFNPEKPHLKYTMEDMPSFSVSLHGVANLSIAKNVAVCELMVTKYMYILLAVVEDMEMGHAVLN